METLEKLVSLHSAKLAWNSVHLAEGNKNYWQNYLKSLIEIKEHTTYSKFYGFIKPNKLAMVKNICIALERLLKIKWVYLP